MSGTPITGWPPREAVALAITPSSSEVGADADTDTNVRPPCAVSDLTFGRPLVERLPPKAPGGRPASPDAEPLIAEVAVLAELLAQVVELAGRSAIFPGHWETLAEQAMEHHSVRAALLAGQGDVP